jgi:hypothetical protein
MDENAARQVLWMYDADGGMQPGSFITALLSAWMKADFQNRARLASAFPHYAEPMKLMQGEHGPDRILDALHREA